MTKALSIACIPFLALAILLSIFPSINHQVFNAINHFWPVKFLWLTITNLGDFLFLSSLLFMALHKQPRLLINALICALLIHYSVQWAKNFFAILRPEHTQNILNVITLGPALDIKNYSMPSGHTASAFMAAIFIARAHNLHGLRLWLLFSGAMLIGISRIALGAHWPADVCAGAVLGIIPSLICTHKKFDLKHRYFYYLSIVLFLPLIGLALYHAKHIHNTLSLFTEGVIVATGFAALIVWVLEVKRIFFDKPLSEQLTAK